MNPVDICNSLLAEISALDKPPKVPPKPRLNYEEMEYLAAEIREQKAAKPVKSKEEKAFAEKRSIYNMSFAEHDYMLQQQGGVCAICGSIPGKGQVLHIDHCHTTGMIRGLLCRSCNTGLGIFKDNTKTLTFAIAYLENARKIYNNASPEELRRARACPQS